MARMRQLKITKSVTNRQDKSLDKYLSDISKEPLIKAQEEVELAQRIKEGDEKAKEKLIKANVRFVVSVAKQYQNQGLTLPDLINEGNLGLIKAAGRFDHTRGFKFISYAVWWIRQSILQALAEQSRVVRLPLNQIGSMNKINKAMAKLEQEYERMPSAEELATLLDLPSESVEIILNLGNGRHMSLDAPMTDYEGSNSLLDMLYDKSAVPTDGKMLNESVVKEIERALSSLSGREEDVLRLYFGINMSHGLTLEEIGAKFDLTRERVRQIKEKGIRRLRHGSRNQLMRACKG